MNTVPNSINVFQHSTYHPLELLYHLQLSGIEYIEILCNFVTYSLPDILVKDYY